MHPIFNMENQNIRVATQWEHSLTNLLGHDSTSDPGIALRQWVHFQGVENILDLLSWEENELKAIPAPQVFTLDNHGQGSYLRTNQTKHICGLITYMKHVFRDYNSGIEVRTDPFHPFLPEECYLLNHIACTALDGKIPLLALTGIIPDIFIILLFTFYQPVFYATYDQHFPSESEERAGYWVGFGEHCGDAMTHKS